MDYKKILNAFYEEDNFCRHKKLHGTEIDLEAELRNVIKYKIQDFCKCKKDIRYFLNEEIDEKDYLDRRRTDMFKMLQRKERVAMFLSNEECQNYFDNVQLYDLAMYVLHRVLFYNNSKIGILAPTLKESNHILSGIKMHLELTPKWRQPITLQYNKSRIEFDNGSKITAGAISSDSCKAESINILFVHKANIPTLDRMNDMWEAVYPIVTSSHGKVILTYDSLEGEQNFVREIFTGNIPWQLL